MNPKHAIIESAHNNNSSAIDCNKNLLEGRFEKRSHNNSGHLNTLSQHKLGANMVRVNCEGPDLEDLIKTWPQLPVQIKAVIRALIQTHT